METNIYFVKVHLQFTKGNSKAIFVINVRIKLDSV